MIRVVPSGSMWTVERNGATVSNHYEKDNAVAKARQKADDGEAIEVRRRDGTIQDRYRRQR